MPSEYWRDRERAKYGVEAVVERKDLRSLAKNRGAVFVTVEREDRLPEYATDEQLAVVRRRAASESLQAALERDETA